MGGNNSECYISTRSLCILGGMFQSVYGDHELDHEKRMSLKDRMMIWKEITLTGWGGKLRIELEKDFIKSKRYCPNLFGLHVHPMFKVRLMLVLQEK